MTAAFTPRDVTFVSPTTLKYSTTIYRVDRTDLAFSEEHKIGEKSFWRRGSCELAPKVERSEEHTSELQSLMRISYAVFCLKKKKTTKLTHIHYNTKTSHIITHTSLLYHITT